MIQQALIKKQRIVLCILLLLIVLTTGIGVGIGYASIPYERIIPTFFGQGTFKEEFILFSIRLPRICITLLAGMALALSGAILQGITRNDLADPGIIGINSGSGVAIAIFFLFFPIEAGSFVYIIPIVSFLGAVITGLLIYLDRKSV